MRQNLPDLLWKAKRQYLFISSKQLLHFYQHVPELQHKTYKHVPGIQGVQLKMSGSLWDF